MPTIGIRELKSQATRIVRAVREDDLEYVITVNGRPAAILRPFTQEDEARLRQRDVATELAALDALAEEIGAAWDSPYSGVELVEQQRRYLQHGCR